MPRSLLDPRTRRRRIKERLRNETSPQRALRLQSNRERTRRRRELIKQKSASHTRTKALTAAQKKEIARIKKAKYRQRKKENLLSTCNAGRILKSDKANYTRLMDDQEKLLSMYYKERTLKTDNTSLMNEQCMQCIAHLSKLEMVGHISLICCHEVNFKVQPEPVSDTTKILFKPKEK